MSGGSRPQKVEEWTNRLARYGESGQTIAEFCRNEGVSAPSFYQWKKKLGTSCGFQPVRIASGSSVSRHGTIVRLGRGVEIELGSDLSVVECVMQQLLAAADPATRTERGRSC